MKIDRFISIYFWFLFFPLEISNLYISVLFWRYQCLDFFCKHANFILWYRKSGGDLFSFFFFLIFFNGSKWGVPPNNLNLSCFILQLIHQIEFTDYWNTHLFVLSCSNLTRKCAPPPPSLRNRVKSLSPGGGRPKYP